MANQRLPGGGAGRQLRRMLVSGEQVEAYAKGKNASLLVATDRRVIIVRRGWTWGVWKVASFGYPQITSVERYNNMLGTFIQINTGGVPGAQAANSFPVGALGGASASQTVAVIQSHLYAPTAQPTAQPATQASIPDQIAALARLRDAGALSNAEYEAKKAELLARM